MGGARKELLQYVVDVMPDVQVISQRAADQREEPCCSLAAGDTPGKQPVLSSQRDLLHQLFYFVIVNRQRSVGQVTLKFQQVIANVWQRTREIALGKNYIRSSRLNFFQPQRHPIPNRFRFTLAQRQSLSSSNVPDSSSR